MAVPASSAVRVTEIVSLLRPERSRKLPEWLGAAAAIGDIDCMQLFVDRGADLEARGYASATPLCNAVTAGQHDAVRWLAAKGARLESADPAVSPMRLALSKADCPMVSVLLACGASVESTAWGAIAAATLGRLDMLLWLLGLGLKLDQSYPGVGELRTRCLHNARKDGGDSRLLPFLRGEIDLAPIFEVPPAQDWRPRLQPRATADQRLPLRAEALQLISAAGRAAARWKATGQAAQKRELLLAFAAGMGQCEIVQALLDAGASADAADDGTAPPLTRAAGEAELDVVRLLLARGAKPDGVDGKSWLPLASACLSGAPNVVQALLDAGANPRAKPLGRQSLKDYVRGPYATEIAALLDSAIRARVRPGAAGNLAAPR